MSPEDLKKKAEEVEQISLDRYNEMKGKYGRLKFITVICIFVVMVSAGFVGKYVKDTRDLADGVAAGTCAIVSIVEAGSDTNAKLIDAIEKSPRPLTQVQRDTLKARRASRETSEKLAAKLRQAVACPPRVAAPELKSER
jgi:hypothetical protein